MTGRTTGPSCICNGDCWDAGRTAGDIWLHVWDGTILAFEHMDFSGYPGENEKAS